MCNYSFARCAIFIAKELYNLGSNPINQSISKLGNVSNINAEAKDGVEMQTFIDDCSIFTEVLRSAQTSL